MSLTSLASRSTAALAGCAMLALSLSPASAMTIPAPGAVMDKAGHADIDKVWWRHRGWGWGPGAIIGGLAAGALLGGAYAYGNGYYGYGPGYYGYDDGCMRRVWGYYGPHWVNVC
jgi:hypothetical protein